MRHLKSPVVAADELHADRTRRTYETPIGTSVRVTRMRVAAAWQSDFAVPSRALRAMIVLAGLVIPQAILHGPSMVGTKILLPVDILSLPRWYLPRHFEPRIERPQDEIFLDEILAIEPARQFAVSEVRQGRLPLWCPNNYCGAPFLAANQPAVFSPFRVLDYLFPGPRTIAWTQLAKAIFAGIGAYLFFRVVMGVNFWPACVGAWCFPLIGFFVFWRGYPLSFVPAWMPWVFLATDGTVRRSGGWSGMGLAVATAGMLVSGHAATAIHVLLANGAYFLFSLFAVYGVRIMQRAAFGSIFATLLGWTVGFLLSAPQNLPTLDYLQTSRRVSERMSGRVEIPPVGLSALPQMVLPYFYGSTRTGAAYIGTSNPLESPASAYAGLLVALVLAPLGWCSRNHRWFNVFWTLLALGTASQVLDVPIVVDVFQVFPLKLLQNNRFVFVTAWCELAMAVAGWDVLCRGDLVRRWWFAIPASLVTALGAWCGWRAWRIPAEAIQQASAHLGHALSADELARIQPTIDWFVSMYIGSALLCLLALLIWAGIGLLRHRGRGLAAMTAMLAVGELVWMGYGVNPQCDPVYYYPRIAVLEQLASHGPGRICGMLCLPARLNQPLGLVDIRGYDAADPLPLVEILALSKPEPGYSHEFGRTSMRWFVGATYSRILDMLNVRYLVWRERPPLGTNLILQGNDYWVTERPNFLPRVYVPRRVERLPTDDDVLRRLGQARFDPREVVFVDGNEPISAGPCRGTATITADVPSEIRIALDMQTHAVVVLADLWYEGWKAYLDGRIVNIHRANHALRGVRVERADRELIFRYEPSSFRNGLVLLGVGIAIMIAWGAAIVWRQRPTRGIERTS